MLIGQCIEVYIINQRQLIRYITFEVITIKINNWTIYGNLCMTLKK